MDFVLDGGPSEVGIESTIVDLSGPDVVLLRPGRISERRSKKLLKVKVKDPEASSPRHSGGLERHYAPQHAGACWCRRTSSTREIAKRGAAVAVLAFSRPDERVDYWIRMPRDPQAYAQTPVCRAARAGHGRMRDNTG